MWDVASRGMHFRFEALRKEQQPVVDQVAFENSPIKVKKKVTFATPGPNASKKLSMEDDLLDFDRINEKYSKKKPEAKYNH